MESDEIQSSQNAEREEGARSRRGATRLDGVWALVLAALALIPYFRHQGMDFKSDDTWLIGRGYGQGLWEGLIDAFSKPFLDTVLVDFYRPLYSYLYVLKAHLFGGDAHAYYVANMVWHGLAVALGYLVLRRVMERPWAALAVLWFGLSPWCVNNVAWMVGACTSLCSVFVFASLLAYFRFRDRGSLGLPWLAFAFATLGVFFRETALFVPFLAMLFDLVSGKRDLKSWSCWFFLTLPFVVYLGCRRLILGTFGGGYAKIVELWGPPLESPSSSEQAATYGLTVLRLFAPGEGLFAEDWSGWRVASIGVMAVLLLGAAVWGAGKKIEASGLQRIRGVFALFFLFVVAHGVPLLYVDATVHGGSSQRWHTVLWGIGALLALSARRWRRPWLGALLLTALIVGQSLKTDEWLGAYEESAAFTKELRRHIDEAPTRTVFVYNVIPYDGPSPNFEAGLGQLAREPFSRAGKALYPVMYEQRYLEGEATAQTPIAARLFSQGHPVTALWCDWKERRIDTIPVDYFQRSLQSLAALRRLEVSSPAEAAVVTKGPLKLELETTGLKRLDLHLITPVAEFLFSRYPGKDYAHGSFEEEGRRYVEELGPMLEAADFMAEQADHRAWLWLVGYDRTDRSQAPIAVSDFIEIQLKR